MSTDRDTTRIVRAWLEDGVTQLPDRVLDDVLDQLPRVGQRRGPWHSWRMSPMLVSASASLAAAVVVAMALILSGVVPVELRIGAQPTPSPTPAPMRSGALDAGTYVVTSVSGLSIEVTVPEGWTGYDDWGFVGPPTEFPPDGLMLGFWDVGNLYEDPLEFRLLDPPIGPMVDDLVAGLTAQPRHSVGAPVDVTIDGFTGKMVELTVPEDEEFSECFAGGTTYRLWNDGSGGYRCLQGPGQIDRIWILDVDGTRLVIDAHHFPGTAATDLEALNEIIESIRITVDAPASTP